MIDAKELRIGNWVYDFGRNPVQIIRLMKDKQPLEEPIPLTTEILKKCGFYKSHSRYKFDFPANKNFFFLTGFYDNDGSIIDFFYGQWGSAGIDTKIKSLHQLQNLYYALTQKELEIKLNETRIT